MELNNNRKYAASWPEVAMVSMMGAAALMGTNNILRQDHSDTELVATSHAIAFFKYQSDTEMEELEREEAEFLAFLEQEMARNPEVIAPIDEAQMTRIEKLVAKVKL